MAEKLVSSETSESSSLRLMSLGIRQLDSDDEESMDWSSPYRFYKEGGGEELEEEESYACSGVNFFFFFDGGFFLRRNLRRSSRESFT